MWPKSVHYRTFINNSNNNMENIKNNNKFKILFRFSSIWEHFIALFSGAWRQASFGAFRIWNESSSFGTVSDNLPLSIGLYQGWPNSFTARAAFEGMDRPKSRIVSLLLMCIHIGRCVNYNGRCVNFNFETFAGRTLTLRGLHLATPGIYQQKKN